MFGVVVHKAKVNWIQVSFIGDSNISVLFDDKSNFSYREMFNTGSILIKKLYHDLPKQINACSENRLAILLKTVDNYSLS